MSYRLLTAGHPRPAMASRTFSPLTPENPGRWVLLPLFNQMTLGAGETVSLARGTDGSWVAVEIATPSSPAPQPMSLSTLHGLWAGAFDRGKVGTEVVLDGTSRQEDSLLPA